MFTTGQKLMTAEELEALPDDGNRYELLEGELLTMPPSSESHGTIAGRIMRRMTLADPDGKLGEIISADAGFKLAVDPDTLLAPDAAFLVRARVRPPGEKVGFGRGSPDIAVEVLSPSNTASEMNRKVDYYLRTGSTLVWLVDPQGEVVTVYERGKEPRFLRGDDELSAAPILPAFKCRVADLFV
ncbi:MAG: Uma2 family endonuclease [Dehalococcoidia bacterium]